MISEGLRTAFRTLCKSSEAELALLLQEFHGTAELRKISSAWNITFTSGFPDTGQDDATTSRATIDASRIPPWVDTMIATLPVAKTLLATEPSQAIGRSPCEGDPRIVDIKRSFNTITDHLRRGLGSISLAISFLDFRRSISAPFSMAGQGPPRLQYISDFIKAIGAVDPGNSTQIAVKYGIHIHCLQQALPHFPRLPLLIFLAFKTGRNFSNEVAGTMTAFFGSAEHLATLQAYNNDFHEFSTGQCDWMRCTLANYSHQCKSLSGSWKWQRGVDVAVRSPRGPDDNLGYQKRMEANYVSRWPLQRLRQPKDQDISMSDVIQPTDLDLDTYQPSNEQLEATVIGRRCPSSSSEFMNRMGETELSDDLVATFLHHLSSDPVPVSMLDRATCSQKRWLPDGQESIEVGQRLCDTDSFLTILFDATKQQKAVQRGLDTGTVRCCEWNGQSCYVGTTRRPPTADIDSDCVWSTRVLIFVAFITPRNAPTSTSPSPDCDTILPAMRVAYERLRRVGALHLTPIVVNELLEAFLSSTAMHGGFSDADTLANIGRILHDRSATHLRLLLLLRRSVSLRGRGHRTESEAVLKDMRGCWKDYANTDYERYLHGRLLLSKAENAIHANRLEDAQNLLEQCARITEDKVIKNKTMDCHLQRMRVTAYGRVYRYRGDFDAALTHFEMTMNAPEMDQPEGIMQKCHALHHLSDVYCELGKPKVAQTRLDPTLTKLRAGNVNSVAFRRLLQCSVEIAIRTSDILAAEKYLKWLTETFDNMQVVDPADQVGHVYCEIKYAMIDYTTQQEGACRLEGSRQHLLKAKRLLNRYETFESDGYYIYFVNQFLDLVHNRLGNPSVMASAGIVPCHERRYFMVGVGTHDHNFVQAEMEKFYAASTSNVSSL